MGYVYKITNTRNNKSYIGISIHEPEKRRIKDHLSGYGNRLIANAVEKYGKDAFTYEILEANVFPEFLPDLEVAYIANYNTVAPHGYNLNSGGFHAIPSVNTCRKISESRKGEKHPFFGKKLSKDHSRKISEALSGEKHPNFGKKLSASTRRKMSESRKGEKNHNFGKPRSASTRRKICEAQKGKKRKPLSVDHRRKISESNSGERNHFYGKRHTPETLRKLSESRKRLPEYVPAHEFFLSLPADIPLKEKRKLLYAKFPNVTKDRICKWVRKWSS